MSEQIREKLELTDTSGNVVISLDQGGSADIGGSGQDGDIKMFNKDGEITIRMDADGGNIIAGGHGCDGDINLMTNLGNYGIILDAQSLAAWFGGEPDDATITIDGRGGNIIMGGHGVDGDINLMTNMGNYGIILDAQSLSAWFGGEPDEASIHIDGAAGDIVLRNADCAEEFDITEEVAVDEGTVMVMNGDQTLHPCEEAYDKRVAGIISGAGEYKPGLVLDRQQTDKKRLPVALMGKVCCKVDAQYGAVEVGDLLTSSPTPGHAMKASDISRAFGTIIGKALRPLEEGTGLVPVLVSLQ